MAPELQRNGSSSATSHRSTIASVTRDKFSDVMSNISKPENGLPTRYSGFKDGWDTLVKVMFAPCAGVTGDIGGVPRDEIIDIHSTPPRGGGSTRVGGDQGASSPAWGASVPFEVSSQTVGASLISGVVPPTSQSGTHHQDANNNNSFSFEAFSSSQYPFQQQRALTPRKQRKAKSRAKLRQLGAQHQLSSGFHGESLADTARPISRNDKDAAVAAALGSTTLDTADGGGSSPELIDFDDGISAISSHTLEEMERRRQAKDKKNTNIVRLHPLDFSQIIDENTELKYTEQVSPGGGGLGLVPVKEVNEQDTEVVFGQPFYEENGLFQNVRNTDVTKNDTKKNPSSSLIIEPPVQMNRVTSTKTHSTTITEDSHEFEEMYKRNEAMYWVDEDQVAEAEKTSRRRSSPVVVGTTTDRRGSSAGRQSQRMSIEERARRLRELSRSRSRSDGTGSVSFFSRLVLVILL